MAVSLEQLENGGYLLGSGIPGAEITFITDPVGIKAEIYSEENDLRFNFIGFEGSEFVMRSSKGVNLNVNQIDKVLVACTRLIESANNEGIIDSAFVYPPLNLLKDIAQALSSKLEGIATQRGVVNSREFSANLPNPRADVKSIEVVGESGQFQPEQIEGPKLN